jgi:hypothetical protein
MHHSDTQGMVSTYNSFNWFVFLHNWFFYRNATAREFSRPDVAFLGHRSPLRRQAAPLESRLSAAPALIAGVGANVLLATSSCGWRLWGRCGCGVLRARIKAPHAPVPQQKKLAVAKPMVLFASRPPSPTSWRLSSSSKRMTWWPLLNMFQIQLHIILVDFWRSEAEARWVPLW